MIAKKDGAQSVLIFKRECTNHDSHLLVLIHGGHAPRFWRRGSIGRMWPLLFAPCFRAPSISARDKHDTTTQCELC